MTIEERAAEFGRVFAREELNGWTYYSAGKGEDVVLLLPGGVGIGIGWLDLALALHDDHRTITVDYPPFATTMSELVDGLLAVLEAEGVDRVHVVGQSAGGMVAQVLVDQAPDRVASLVFSGTGLYGPEDVDRLAGKLAALRTTPLEEVLDTARPTLRAAWPGSADADFWIAQVEAAYRRGGRDGVVNSYAYLLDLARTSGDLRPGWQGPVLLLAADDDDPLVTAAHQRRLLDLHPGCEVRSFPDGGHSLLLTRPAEYIAAVREFLG
ncbi:alpha/beta fold hydrolase [Lentzea sp. NPDC051213]|uniref:alpha/beta fold hydrolase n=1 Tax=Lentzea sp. NPDC051213 TaxID=3364126 RepID=UPI0037AB398B